MYQETFSFQIQENDNLYIYNFTQKAACMHQPYVLSDQLDRWSRISFVKKAPIHYPRVPGQAGVECKNVPKCVI